MNHSDKPLVSIGVPVYNGEKYLEECLSSVFNQTYSNWECIIVNNCSTDQTPQIAAKFAQKDPRFKLINKTDFAILVDNWNRIGKYISPEAAYLKILQADDWLFTDALEKMVEVMEKYPSAGICSSYRIDGKIVNCDGLDPYTEELVAGKKLLLRHFDEEIDTSGSNSTSLFRMSVIKQLPTYPKIFDDTDYHEDTRLYYEMMLLSDVAFVFQVLSYTRWHDHAETTTTCVRHNTFLNGKEERLYRFKAFFPELEPVYQAFRLRYAYFLLKKKITGQTETLKWHDKFLKRKFSKKEYLKALLTQNGISMRFQSLWSNKKPKRSFIKVYM